MTPFAVYADDYSYIPVDEYYMYNAYNYFKSYGYSFDNTNTVSYAINETGTYTFTGTLTGTINGSELTTFNVSLSSRLSSLDDDAGITYGSNGSIFGFGSSGDVVTMYIDPVDSVYHYYASSYGCEVGTWADTSTGDREANVWRCNPNTAYGHEVIYEPPEYELTLGGINIDTTNNGWVHVVLNETGTGSGGMSGNLSLSESQSMTGSGTINLSGSESTTLHTSYTIPSLKLISINESLENSKYITCFANKKYNISVLSNSTMNLRNAKLYDSQDNEISYILDSYNAQYIGGYLYNSLTFHTSTTGNYYFKFQSYPEYLIPIYVGDINYMNDDTFRFIYGSDRTNELLENGNSNSQQAISNNNTMTNSFSQASNSMHNIETTWENNLDTNIQNIPTSSSMYNNNKFIATANWVRTQFERIVLNTPFELLLVFSLILGIALVLIGKVR